MKKALIVALLAAALVAGIIYTRNANADCNRTCYNGQCVMCCCTGSVCNCF